jgi:signal transduction histidine kinase
MELMGEIERGLLVERPFLDSLVESVVGRGERTYALRAMRLLPRTLILSAVLGVMAAGQDAPEVLTRCADVRNLPRQEAAQRVPLHVRGVVTRLGLGGFVIHDDVGIFVALKEAEELRLLEETVPEFKIGDVLDIVGMSGRGHFAPVIWPRTVRLIGPGKLPPPLPVTLADIESGSLDSQRVVISGVVRSAEILRDEDTFLRLTMASTGGTLFYTQTDPTTFAAVDELVDAEVSLTGVVGHFFNTRGETVTDRLFSSQASDLKVTKPAPPDPFGVPALSIRHIQGFDFTKSAQHRRMIRGTVLLCEPGVYFYLEAERRGIRVETKQKDELQPGDLVEAAGFVASGLHFAMLHDAVFRRTGSSVPPEPISATRSDIMKVYFDRSWADPDDFDGRLVTMTGPLYGIEQRPKERPVIYIETDGQLTPASLPALPRGALSHLRIGDKLSLTGVCQMKFNGARSDANGPFPTSVEILLRSVNDVRVLQAAPWWTAQRLIIALGIALFVIVMSFTWVAVLRKRVAARGAQLAQEIRARRDVVVEHTTTQRERTRLAADLHDTLEQSLTGLALQLEAATVMQQEAPERSLFHLGLAQNLLDRSREDVRRNVWNLRMNPLNHQTLEASLRTIAADRSVGLPVSIEVTCEDTPRKLPESISVNLMLVAQEAITNSLKHAAPRNITLHVGFTTTEVALTIKDDGRGFEPVAAPSYKEGHFGVQGMKERMMRIGGSFRLESKVDMGTSIHVVVPSE